MTDATQPTCRRPLPGAPYRVRAGRWTLLLAAKLLLAAAAMGQPPRVSAEQDSSESLRRALYRAAIAAADSSLALHRTDDAHKWLERAPRHLRDWEWHYLHGAADQSSASYAAHTKTITHVAISPDGRHIATGSADGTAQIRDANSGQLIHELAGHTAAVWSPAFSPDGRQLATISSDGTARLWSVESGKTLSTFDEIGKGVSAICWSPDQRLLAACSWDLLPKRQVVGFLSLLDVQSGTQRPRIENGVKPAASIAFSPDGKQLAIGSWDRDVTLWNTANWEVEQTLLPPDDEYYQAINCVAYAPDGTRLAAVAKDGTIRIWDLQTKAIARTLIGQSEGQRQWINGVVWLDDDRLASTGADATVRVWNAANGRQTHLFHGARRSQTSIAYDAARKRLVTAGADRMIHVWDLPVAAAGVWHTKDVMYSLSHAPSGGQAVAAGWTGWIEILDTATGQSRHAWKGHEESGVGAEWSPDGKWLATTGNDGRVLLWNSASRELHKELLDLDGVQIRAATFRADGKFLVSGGPGGKTYVWSVPDGELARTLQHGDATFSFFDWKPDGSRLATSASDGTVCLWSWPDGELVAEYKSASGGPRPVKFHPANSHLLIGGPGARVSVRDTSGGGALWSTDLPSTVVNSVAWSGSGTRVAVCLRNNSVAILEADTGEPLLALPFDSSTWAAAWRDADLLVIPLDRTIRVFPGKPASPAASLSTGADSVR